MAEDVARMMERVALACVEDYTRWLEEYDPYMQYADFVMSIEAYVRARVMNEIEPATRFALQYAETQGGL